jgi:transposase InsO family protein
LGKAKTEKEAHGEFESECPGYCGAQDTFYVGNMKGVGRIYQQTFVDTYSKVAFAKLYERKTPITAADLLNDRVVPFFDEKEVKLLRVLTDRGTEYWGNPEHHEYELYLAVEDIDHSRTKTKSPQTNGMVESLHKTMLNEFYRIALGAVSLFFIVSRSWRCQTPRTPAGEIEWPSFLISLATRIWPKAGCSSENSTIRAAISGAVRFARIGFLRLISCTEIGQQSKGTRVFRPAICIREYDRRN